MLNDQAWRARLAKQLEEVAASILRYGFDAALAESYLGPTCFIGHTSRLGFPTRVEDVIAEALGHPVRGCSALSARSLNAHGLTTPLAADFCIDLAAAVRAGCVDHML